MPAYNLLEYSDNYADSFGCIYQFKRDEQNMNNGNIANVTTADSSSFKYKPSILGDLVAAGANGVLKISKILYIFIISRTRFRVNPHSIVA